MSKKLIKKIFPFLDWIKDLKNKNTLKSDIIAGSTVGLIVIPQSMAYAWLAWLPLEVWLYTAFIPIIIWWLFGSSKQMSTGPVTIVSLMTATALAPIAVSSPEWYIAYASLLAFFIWIFYILLWTMKLGVIVEFLSHPVVIGFTNAIALITIISQSNKIFWITSDKSGNFIENIYSMITTAIDSTHFITFIFWFGAIIVLLLLQRFVPKWPRILILLWISIVTSFSIWYSTNYWWKIVWNIPNELPSFSLPFLSEHINWINIETVMSLIMFSIIIWLIGFTESISVAKWVWARTKQKVSANRELMGQWIANLFSWSFGWYWVAWSFSRTAVNLRAWAKTWFSSVVTWILVWLTIMFLTPILFHLPQATLAAIIIIAVASLIKIEPIIEAWKIQKHDALVAVITFMATIWFAPSVENWILSWIILSLWLYIYRSMKPKIIEVSMYKNWVLRDAQLFNLKKSKDVSIFRVDWSLYFANAWHFETKILDFISEKKNLKIVIFDFEWMSNIDSSWYVILKDLTKQLEKSWIEVYLSSMRVKVLHKLDNVWYLKKIWKKKVFHKIENAIDFLKDKYDKKELNIKALLEYSPKKNPELEDLRKEVVEKYGK